MTVEVIYWRNKQLTVKWREIFWDFETEKVSKFGNFRENLVYFCLYHTGIIGQSSVKERMRDIIDR